MSESALETLAREQTREVDARVAELAELTRDVETLARQLADTREALACEEGTAQALHEAGFVETDLARMAASERRFLEQRKAIALRREQLAVEAEQLERLRAERERVEHALAEARAHLKATRARLDAVAAEARTRAQRQEEGAQDEQSAAAWHARKQK